MIFISESWGLNYLVDSQIHHSLIVGSDHSTVVSKFMRNQVKHRRNWLLNLPHVKSSIKLQMDLAIMECPTEAEAFILFYEALRMEEKQILYRNLLPKLRSSKLNYPMVTYPATNMISIILIYSSGVKFFLQIMIQMIL